MRDLWQRGADQVERLRNELNEEKARCICLEARLRKLDELTYAPNAPTEPPVPTDYAELKQQVEYLESSVALKDERINDLWKRLQKKEKNAQASSAVGALKADVTHLAQRLQAVETALAEKKPRIRRFDHGFVCVRKTKERNKPVKPPFRCHRWGHSTHNAGQSGFCRHNCQRNKSLNCVTLAFSI